MTALELLQTLTEALYLLTAVATAYRAARRPRRWTLDAAAFFGVATAVILMKWVPLLLQSAPPVWAGQAAALLIMAMPYLLVRLLGDFVPLPRLATWVAGVGLVLAELGLLLLPAPLDPLVVFAMVGYFAGCVGYAAVTFGWEARRTVGMTQRRMQAVAAGTANLGFDIVVAGVASVVVDIRDTAAGLMVLSGLLSALCYVLAFSPPQAVRRLWRMPQLLAFLDAVAGDAVLSDEPTVVRRLEQQVAEAMAAEGAALTLLDESRSVLVAHNRTLLEALPLTPVPGVRVHHDRVEIAPPPGLSVRTLVPPQAQFVDQVADSLPDWRELVRANHIRAMVVAPMRWQQRVLGVLTVYTSRPPAFAAEDVELAQVLADQCAAVVNAHRLVDAGQRAQAVERAAGMKAEFLAAAAHD